MKATQRTRVYNLTGRLLRRFVTVLAILAFILLGPLPSARADTSVCGPITVDTTWTQTGNNYVITCLVQVGQNVTLTIENGTRVHFNPGTALRIDGTLVAQGVTFTSNASTPAKGNWAFIYFSTTSHDAVFDPIGNYVSGSMIQDSLIVYGGGGTGVTGSIVIDGASPFIDHNNVRLSSTRGIYAVGRSSSQKIVISRNTIIDNNGGGLYISSGIAKNNTVSNNNQSGSRGGGVYATDSTLDSNTINNNTGAEGGGIYSTGSIIIKNTVSGNTSAHERGGGIYAVGGSLSDNIVTGNTVVSNPYWDNQFGAGIYISGGTLIHNTIQGNTTTANTGYGGGVYATLSTVKDNLIDENSVKAGGNAYGGGIYALGCTVSDNQITGNTAYSTSTHMSYGGGIYSDGGMVSDNMILNNTAAGGIDNQGGGIYGRINTLQLNSITGNSANIGGAIYSYKGAVTSNTVLTNTTALSGTLYIDQGTATLNTFRANSAVAGGAIYGTGATLTGNTAEDNSANFGAGIYGKNSTVRGNTLSGNNATSDGGGIYANGGTVTNNILMGNTAPSWGHGSGAYIIGVTDFSYNEVLTNTATGGTSGGVSVSGQPTFQYNNLYGNQPYDAEVVSSQLVTGILNYWGLSACTAIPAQIYDGNDAPGRGMLSYAPSLYSPVPVAQLAAPTNLMMSNGPSGMTLSWTALPAIPNSGCRVPGSSAPDLTYRVYYDQDSCPPYNGTGLPQGASPIEAGTSASFTFSGVSGQGYAFAVTAHDYLGRESAFSNQVGAPATQFAVYLPLLSK